MLQATLECLRYWRREVIGGFAYRRALSKAGVDLGSVSLRRLGFDPRSAHNHANSGGPDLEVVLRSLEITPSHAVLDLGCGKGGALLTLARFPFSRVVGLDLSPEMLDIARRNLDRMGLHTVELICADASAFDAYDAFTHLYMYNPFPSAVVQAVMTAVEASVIAAPRTVTVIYKNPRFHDDVIRGGVFSEVGRMDHSGHPYIIYRNAAVSGC